MYVICAMAAFVSCDDGDLSNPLAGTWTLTGTTIQNCKDKDQNISTIYSCDGTACRSYVFDVSGQLTVTILDGETTTTSTGSYTVAGSTAVINIDTRPHSISGETFLVTRSGQMLYLKEVISDLSGKCSATIVLTK